MAEEPDEADGSPDGEEAKPWPVVSRSMINYGRQAPPSQFGEGFSREDHYRRTEAWRPGRMLALIGLMLTGVAFVGWIANLVRFLRSPEPSFAAMLGPELPSSTSVGVVHAFAFVAGVLLILAGAAMRRARIWVQILALILLITAVVVLMTVVLGGAPVSVLLPDFSP